MHEPIKNFFMNGIIGDSKLVQTKDRLVNETEAWMRDEGYAPVAELIPQFTLNYRPTEEEYDFELTVYGAYVGDNAWHTSVVTDGKAIPSSIRPAK